jgi:hypothetical protein
MGGDLALPRSRKRLHEARGSEARRAVLGVAGEQAGSYFTNTTERVTRVLPAVSWTL